jgi:hypothetical protein
MGFIKSIKTLALKALSFTALDPLDADFPHLPPGKYGQYICQICRDKKAERWHERTRVLFCFDCALKIKGWN